MKKITRKLQKEERKDILNEPLVIIEQDSALTKKRVISYPFNKEKRDKYFAEDAKKSNEPGPGSYNIENKKNISQNVVSKNSRFPNYENKNPGVGEYNIAESELNVEYTAPKYQIPKAQRKNPFEVTKEKRRVPGVGNYKLNIKYPNNFYMEQKVERFHTVATNKPGVGDYDINEASLKLKKKTGISTNRAERKDPFEASKESKNVPGIGTYNILKQNNKGIYIERKKQRFSSASNGRPGVGEYDINDAELRLKKKTGIASYKSKRKGPFEVGNERKSVPGAGSYNISNAGKNKFYMEMDLPRFTSSDNGKPGVGEYDINDAEIKLKEKRSIAAVKSKRKGPFEVNKEKKLIPGAGSYNINKTEIKGVYIEANAPRFSTSNNGRPGVGEYNINEAYLKLKKKTGISTNKSKREDPFEATKESKNIPGAGAYNINIKDSKGVYIEGKKQRFETSYNGKPGVGEYDINDAEIKLKKKTGISTSKSTRKDPFEVDKEQMGKPGAGSYTINKTEIKGVYIEGNKPRFSTSNNGKPGVGEYDINEAELKLKNKTGISTNKSKREDPFEATKESKNVPGVGKYNTIDTNSRKFYIEGNVPRFASSNNGKPGVGEYDINEAELKLKIKTGISTNKSKRKDPFEVGKESKNVPGAGTYNTIETGKNKFYIDNNLPRFTSSDNGKPGVGEYNINDAELKLKKKSRNPFMEKSKRKDPFEVDKEQKGKPGAGSYNINKTEIKGVYIEGNKPRFSTSNNGKPGVGEYDINEAELKLKNKTGISTNKSKREDPFEATKESKNVPGVGKYNTIDTNSRKFYIEGNVPRFASSNNGKPGVGEYDINEAELKLKKKTGISTNKSKRKDPFEVSKENKNIPGTGAYNINKAEQNKFYIEQNMERFGPSGNQNPGVGEYDINEAALKLKKKTGISNVKSVRKDPFEVGKDNKNNPGAGAYNLNKPVNNKFYIEQNMERFGPSGNKNPGVGEYNINEAELKLKKKIGISTNKSERKDPFEVTKENKNIPGTGAYNINKGEQQKFYIEQNMERFTSSNNGKPGVGEYDINEAELKLKQKTGISTNKSKREDPFKVTKESKNTPGTGAYNINKGKIPKFYIEKNMERFGPSSNKNPGVGEYNYSQIEIKLKPKAPEFVEPKAERKMLFVKNNNKGVGPGSYEVKEENSKAGMQKFSILPRKL